MRNINGKTDVSYPGTLKAECQHLTDIIITGQRCCKTVGSVRTDFTYVGSLLARQKSDNLDMRFTYNTLGIPVALWYNGSEYYYVRNLQNDIIGLIDSTGEGSLNIAMTPGEKS